MASDDNKNNSWSWANVPLPSGQPGSGLTFDDLLRPRSYPSMAATGYADANSSGNLPSWANSAGAYNARQTPGWSPPLFPQPAPFSLASAVASLPAPATPAGYRFGWDGSDSDSGGAPPRAPYMANPGPAF
jgi:hypothetical protein